MDTSKARWCYERWDHVRRCYTTDLAMPDKMGGNVIARIMRLYQGSSWNDEYRYEVDGPPTQIGVERGRNTAQRAVRRALRETNDG